MNRRLAQKIFELFRDEVRPHAAYFANYSERDWRKTKTWLDSSGIALYFLRRLKELGLQDSVPSTIFAELEQNLADRQLEVKQRVARFAELLQLFQQHNVRFAVEKGLALIPAYCPEIELRFQVDFDFLVDPDDVERCHELLLSSGYRYLETIHGERRFNTGDVGTPSMSDFYKSKRKHTVELHFGTPEDTRSKLTAAVPHHLGSLVFPVLSPVDGFAEYVLHFVKHLRVGWVRTDAMLEYRRFVRSVEGDRGFWAELQRRCETDVALRQANVIMALLAREVLGAKVAPELAGFVNATPAGVRRWAVRYAWSVLLVEYPGPKLHLILELESGQHNCLSCIRMMFPSRYLPRRVAETESKVGWTREALSTEVRYILVRCRYHIYEICRTSYELLVWSCIRAKPDWLPKRRADEWRM